MLLASPTGIMTGSYTGFERAFHKHTEQRRLHEERVGSSSPEPMDPPIRLSKKGGPVFAPGRRMSHTMDYSGTDIASHSDFSDAEFSRIPLAATSTQSVPEPLAVKPPPTALARNSSQLSGFNPDHDPERVIWQGHLLYLKTKGGVRQWKDLWAVIRRNNVALYKNESEYSPVRLIPIGGIINAVEIDPLSKTKRHCLQLILEEKSYKFCAVDEKGLDNALGALKSCIARRKEEMMLRS